MMKKLLLVYALLVSASGFSAAKPRHPPCKGRRPASRSSEAKSLKFSSSTLSVPLGPLDREGADTIRPPESPSSSSCVSGPPRGRSKLRGESMEDAHVVSVGISHMSGTALEVNAFEDGCRAGGSLHGGAPRV